MSISTPKTKKVTYLGIPAEVTEYNLGFDGRRLVATKWMADAKGQEIEHPAGTVVVQIVKGDTRRGNFQSFARITMKPGQDAQATIEDLLRLYKD